MSRPKSMRVLVPVVSLTLVLIVSLACGDTTTEKLEEAAEEPTPTTAADEPTTAPTERPTEQEPTPAGDTPSPTSPPPPTATAAGEAEPIQIVKHGFGQDDQELGYAFLIENPNAGFAVETSQYQIAAYDDGGAVLETDSGYIEVVLPGQTLAIAGTMWLDEGMTVSSIEVQLLEGDSVATEPLPIFTVESAAFFGGDFSDYVTGLVNNPYNLDLQDLRLSAVTYSAGGDIIGGGFGYLNFIHANGSTGAKVSVSTARDVATVELYPTVSGLTFLWDEVEVPEGASNVNLVKQGFGQDDTEVGFGMLIENPNDAFAIEDSQYHITFFAEDGRVLGTEEGYVEVLLPNQTLGIGGSSYLVMDMNVARIDAQILAGDYVESEQLPYFTAENVTYQPDEWFPQATGQIVNPYNKDITDLRVSAILYDEQGEIVGGGFTYLDFVPANGKAAVELSVTSTGLPATTELYATVSALSEFQ